ncbi:hypothetical protein [Actinomadura mexicana]|uniref:hypothetical protein n=1 Tax=Actinomadura mexicana TaxID=134959 RepID=UPI0011776487|nr:hypothetical protein [Actinomadura mexicana]
MTMQHVGIAGAVGAVVLGLVVAVAIAVTPEDGGGPDERAVAASSAPAGSAVPRPSATAAGSAPPAAPVVRWRGTLTLNGPRARRDLDATPPRLSERDGEPDIRGDWLKPLVEAESDAQVVLMRPGSEPAAARCRDAAATEGADEVEVDEGDVVCVLTAAGRVARLAIVEAHMTSRAPIVRARVVIWDMPGPAQ